MNIALCSGGGTTAVAPIAPHEYCGQMCGVRVPGLQHNVAGGRFRDQALSWFYDRYTPEEQALIRAEWARRGYLDVLLSWPDSRVAGFSPQDFVQTCRELVSHGFRPCVFLLSKYYDPQDAPGCLRNVEEILPLLLAPRAASRICIAWEQSLFLSPQVVQTLVDAIAPRCVAVGIKCYTHDRGGYSKYPEDAVPEVTFGAYWGRQVGKLTGILYQWNLDWHPEDFQPRLTDILERFAGGFNCPADNGIDGHPFDLVALELTAQPQYDGSLSEAEGDRWGSLAITTPPVRGVRVMGSGNGREGNG